MPKIVIVHASAVLSPAEVEATIPALQRWDDEMLRPAWNLDPCVYSFMGWREFQAATPDAWPIFVNKHSTDAGALGWHDDRSGKIFGRVFAGDCLRYGISWTVDLSHEAGEMRADPTIDRTWQMPNGELAIVEVGDPVEDDRFAIMVGGMKMTDFVLPDYFSTASGAYDFQGALKRPCPALTTGGYQSLLVNGQWTQVTAMYLGGPPSFRSQRYHNGRRMPRVTVAAEDAATVRKCPS